MRTHLIAVLLLTGAVAAPSGQAETSASVEEIVARSVEALGGAARWAEIESLVLTGRYSTFSAAAPFVLQRKRPNLYRFEHQEAGMKVTVGFDGRVAWWENTTPFSEVPWPSLPPVTYSRGYEAEAEFEPPFVNAAAKGHQVELLGETEFEGMDVLQLTVTLANGITEQWYLDPASFLPAARLSVAGFKIFETESYRFFSDYRDVSGLQIPHQIETEIDNLVSIMEIDEVSTNVELAPSTFAIPKTPVLERLGTWAGEWQVRVQTRMLPNLPWIPSEGVATFRADFGGQVIEEQLSYLSVGSPRSVKRTYSFDRFRQALRIVQIDNLTAHPNVLEGNAEEDPIQADNLTTGTSWNLRGQVIHDRMVLRDLEEDGFTIDLDRSMDGGQSWWTTATLTYSRRD